jgi:hypothetical protein
VIDPGGSVRLVRHEEGHDKMRAMKLLTAVTAAAVLSTAALGAAVAGAAPAPPAGRTITVPACGTDPATNTRTIQAAIDGAAAGDTVMLPAGDCVVAKCDVAVSTGRPCYGAAGVPHRSALHIGGRSDLTIIGTPGGASTVRLDPAPPAPPGRHPYCGDTYVLSIVLSTRVTLRGFTVDGSDDLLPADDTPCRTDPAAPPGSGRLDEHLHDIAVANAVDLTIDRMRIVKAHGDGLNLSAERTRTAQPRTERVSVTDSDFLANDRAGVTFQRNVAHVTLARNHMLGSGEDQDIDMEPTGGADDAGPVDVRIYGNLFERLRPGIAVALGATPAIRPSQGIRFTNNTIGPAPGADPTAGGCIAVYTAADTTIAGNTVLGGQGCQPIWAQRVDGLTIEGNRLESVDDEQRGGIFQPRAVVDVSERVVNQGDPAVCGAPPREPCPYAVRYPVHVTVSGNTVVQHVAGGMGIRLSNADDVAVTDNVVAMAGELAAVGTMPRNYRPLGIVLPFGVQTLPSYGVYVNEQTLFKTYTVTGNQVRGFDTAIDLLPAKPGVELVLGTLAGNRIESATAGAIGLHLQAPPAAPTAAFVQALTVDANVFGCGFFDPAHPGTPPPHAYVRPAGQAHTGLIGTTEPCR